MKDHRGPDKSLMPGCGQDRIDSSLSKSRQNPGLQLIRYPLESFVPRKSASAIHRIVLSGRAATVICKDKLKTAAVLRVPMPGAASGTQSTSLWNGIAQSRVWHSTEPSSCGIEAIWNPGCLRRESLGPAELAPTGSAEYSPGRQSWENDPI